jgi:hypothetical protein
MGATTPCFSPVLKAFLLSGDDTPPMTVEATGRGSIAPALLGGGSEVVTGIIVEAVAHEVGAGKGRGNRGMIVVDCGAGMGREERDCERTKGRGSCG